MLSTVQRFADIPPVDWNACVNESEQPSLFHTFEWLSTWWEVFRADGDELRISVLRDEAGLRALAPFVLSRDAQTGRPMARFVGDDHNDAAPFCVRAGDDDAVEAIVAEVLRWSADGVDVVLSELPGSSGLSRRLGRAAAGRWSRVERLHDTICPRLTLRDQTQVDALLAKDSLRRHSAKLRKAGVVRVDHLRTPDEIEPWLTTFFDQHIARWRVTEFPSLFRKADNRAFYRRLAATLPPGVLAFTVVRLSDNPVAFHYGYVAYGDFLWYKPSFDITLARLSPGEVLLRELLAFAWGERCRAFDFLRGDESFKRRFATEYPVNHTLVVRKSARTVAVNSGRRVAEGLARRAVAFVAGERLVLKAQQLRPQAPRSRASKAVAVLGLLLRSWASWVRSSRVVRVFSATASQPTEHGSAVEVRELDLAGWLATCKDGSDWPAHGVVPLAYQRLRSGDRSFAAYAGMAVVATVWCSTRSPFVLGDGGLELPLESGDVVLYGLEVAPPFAGRVETVLLRGVRGQIPAGRHWMTTEDGVSEALLAEAGFSQAFVIRQRVRWGRVEVSGAPAAGRQPALTASGGA